MTAAQRCFVVLICGMSSIPGPLYADDEPASTTTPPVAREVREAIDSTELDIKRHTTFTVGLMILSAITFTGLLLLLAVILWGHRVRRRSREPLPDASRGDDLFYLKTGKNQQPDTTVIPPNQPPSED